MATVLPQSVHREQFREADHAKEVRSLEALAKMRQKFGGHRFDDLFAILGALVSQDLFAEPFSNAPIEHRQFRIDGNRGAFAS